MDIVSDRLDLGLEKFVLLGCGVHKPLVLLLEVDLLLEEVVRILLGLTSTQT